MLSKKEQQLIDAMPTEKPRQNLNRSNLYVFLALNLDLFSVTGILTCVFINILHLKVLKLIWDLYTLKRIVQFSKGSNKIARRAEK